MKVHALTMLFTLFMGTMVMAQNTAVEAVSAKSPKVIKCDPTDCDPKDCKPGCDIQNCDPANCLKASASTKASAEPIQATFVANFEEGNVGSVSTKPQKKTSCAKTDSKVCPPKPCTAKKAL